MTEPDETLYSRQLYTFGKDAMMSMSKSSVLITGINGLGMEIAKCVILAGVKMVTLHDTEDITVDDLSSGYYFTEKDIGHNRAEVAKIKLSELNPYVQVNSNTDVLNERDCLQYQVVVSLSKGVLSNISLSNFCHEHNIKFICTETHGVFGYVFCDFGIHTVNDIDGEQPKSGMILMSMDGKLECNKVHDMLNGTLVKIMTKDNTYTDRVKRVPGPMMFELEQTTLPEGSLCETEYLEIKEPVTQTFKNLKTAINEPEFVLADMCDFNRSPTLHTFNLALSSFMEEYKRKPNPWDEQDAELFISVCRMFHHNNTQAHSYDMNVNVLKKLCYTCSGDLCPLNSILGGVVAQEVIKSISNKYNPIKQWFYLDVLNILPDVPLSSNDLIVNPQWMRYTSQIKVLGNTLQQKLNDAKVFVVGSGAIGCEHLKNFAMMGVGNTIITDMDTIERSNLNRQFLFRNKDIGQSKSVVATKVITEMNPNIKVVAHQNRVGEETMGIYNETFFDSLTCVANALDNVQARMFMDSLCLIHGKPLLESGTLGTKGNVQTVIPHLTESYGSTNVRDPPEQSIPVCTLKNFPYQIEHTIQWAREFFEGQFNRAPSNYNKLFDNPNCVDDMSPNELYDINADIEYMLNNIARNYDDCIRMAYNLWHENYRDQIHQLVTQYPSDSITKEGVRFWSGTKKCPTVLHFDINNDSHLGYVHSTSNLWADVFGIQHNDQYYVKTKLATMTPPEMKNNNQVFSANEAEEKERKEKLIQSTDPDSLKVKLRNIITQQRVKVTPLSFEKDDDTNFHVDFMTHTSNIRAMNYGIPPIDRFKTKGIAGKIVPAIATTTTIVSGLVALELLKVIQGFNKLERFGNAYINLAVPFFGFSEPGKVEKKKVGKLEISIWDSFRFGDVTLRELMTFFEKYDVTVSSVSYSTNILYASYQPKKRKMERIDMKISQIIRTLDGKAPNPASISVVVEPNDNDADISEDIMCHVRY